jgi:hypothetical protein
MDLTIETFAAAVPASGRRCWCCASTLPSPSAVAVGEEAVVLAEPITDTSRPVGAVEPSVDVSRRTAPTRRSNSAMPMARFAW